MLCLCVGDRLMLLNRLGELVLKGAVDRLGLLPCRRNNFEAPTILS